MNSYWGYIVQKGILTKPLSGNPASYGAELTFVDGAMFLDAAGTGKNRWTLSKKLQAAESRGWGGTRGEESSAHHSLEGMWERQRWSS